MLLGLLELGVTVKLNADLFNAGPSSIFSGLQPGNNVVNPHTSIIE
jgi:hypothetical protein